MMMYANISLHVQKSHFRKKSVNYVKPRWLWCIHSQYVPSPFSGPGNEATSNNETSFSNWIAINTGNKIKGVQVRCQYPVYPLMPYLMKEYANGDLLLNLGHKLHVCSTSYVIKCASSAQRSLWILTSLCFLTFQPSHESAGWSHWFSMTPLTTLRSVERHTLWTVDRYYTARRMTGKGSIVNE